MANTGEVVFTSASNVDNAGGAAWSNVGFAIDGNQDNRATVNVDDAPTISDFLTLQNPTAHGVPASSTINGYLLRIYKSAAASNSVEDHTVQLLKAGSAVGANKASGSAWPTTDTETQYGGLADLWSTTWLQTDLSTMGVRFAAMPFDTASSGTARVDHATIDIGYTAPVTSAAFFFQRFILNHCLCFPTFVRLCCNALVRLGLSRRGVARLTFTRPSLQPA